MPPTITRMKLLAIVSEKDSPLRGQSIRRCAIDPRFFASLRMTTLGPPDVNFTGAALVFIAR
jgi:hypothetical protein